MLMTSHASFTSPLSLEKTVLCCKWGLGSGGGDGVADQGSEPVSQTMHSIIPAISQARKDQIPFDYNQPKEERLSIAYIFTNNISTCHFLVKMRIQKPQF